MKLSDALRLGSMATPKAVGIRHKGDGSTCALGAVEYAIGCELNNDRNAERYFPCLDWIVNDPISGRFYELSCVIAMLNNGRNIFYNITYPAWTREDIANWIDTVIPADKQEMLLSLDLEATIETAVPVGV